MKASEIKSLYRSLSDNKRIAWVRVPAVGARDPGAQIGILA